MSGELPWRSLRTQIAHTRPLCGVAVVVVSTTWHSPKLSKGALSLSFISSTPCHDTGVNS